jgi:formylglycine-generating enzyme required for sulfatase activity
VHGLSAEWPHDDCPKVFAEGLGNNPRQIKRTVNVFLMLWKLAEKRKDKLQGRIKPIRLAKVVAIQAIYPELYELLKKEPRYLAELEKYYRGESTLPMTQNRRGELISAIRDVSKPEEIPPALVSYISRQSVRNILTLHPLETLESNFVHLKPDDIRLYFTLTRQIENPMNLVLYPYLYEPRMVRIPAGKFLMGTTEELAQRLVREQDGKDKERWEEWFELEQPQHTVELSEYSIGKYPITNREYQAFVSDIGYTPPHDWNGDQFPAEKGSHPVVNVSWNDATAYCKWLSEKTKKQYRLPTEAEWEKAARGEIGFIYPWGNEFDLQKANTSEANNGGTSEVGRFSPQGDSPYGCADMVGNVWEWCNDWLNEDEYEKRVDKIVKNPHGPPTGTYHILRGGSFNFNCIGSRCAIRESADPYVSVNNNGFRVALSHTKLEGSD